MPIIITDFEQGSPEWHEARAGSVGASSIDKIITSKGEPSKQRTEYMMQLAGERITGKCEETFQSIHMANGNEREAAARSLFEMVQGLECQQVGIVYKNEKKDSHCSPDSLINPLSGLELKNPMMKTHVKYLLSGKLPTDYFCQVQMSMYVTERETWWFMSCFEGIKPLIIECHRDEVWIGKCERELNTFNAELNEMVKRLQ